MSYILEFLATNSTGSFELVLICCYVGLLAACVLSIYDKRVMGEFIRTLLRMGATSPETAVTLYEAGYGKKSAVVRALRGNGMFKGTVYEASETVEFDREDHALPVYREKFDPATARFYIPEPLKYRAQVRFEKKGTHVMVLVLGAILFGVLLVAALLLKDQILTIVNQFFDAMKGAEDSDYLYSLVNPGGWL
jgi:hypothetical protein